MKKTIKIIDLLVKLANGEIDCSIKVIFANREYYVIDYFYNEFKDIITFNNLIKFLNNEVEILEDKKIKKILISIDDTSMPFVGNDKYQKLSYSEVDLLMASKINEIIDRLNEMDKGE